ncbi:two-component regulator propeller domain-containing protein [Daejeonella sp.]|uniref:hybrid sensor histidine kinase/response regulator transcription factor n=1 Tax=Daejeonella sp. TaxID=2805397 RepID=UPI0030BC6C47
MISLRFLYKALTVIVLISAGIAWKAVGQSMNFSRLTINEGLSQNTIYSIFQDKTGFVWIGTEDGLNRFDGYEFKVYRHLPYDKNSVRSNQINNIYENKDGNLWIATSTGLDFFDRKTENFKHIDLKQPVGTNTFITYVSGDRFGMIWLGTHYGLKKYDPATGKVTSFSDNIQVISGKTRRTYSVFIGSDDIVWAGVGSEITRINTKNNSTLPAIGQIESAAGWGGSTIRSIKKDAKNNVWISTESSGLFFYSPATGKTVSYNTSNSNILSNTIRDVFVKNENEIWLGTRDGLSILNVGSGAFSNHIYDKYNALSLNHNSVRCFMKDNAGSVWLGTFSGGINIVENTSEKFHTIREQLGSDYGLSHRVVSSITQTSPTDLWMGTEGGGLNYYNKKTGVFKSYLNGSASARNPKNIVKALAVDKNNNLWVGSFDGLSYFSVKTNTFKNFDLPENVLSNNTNLVYSLMADKNGVWAGTDGAGLTFISDKGDHKSYTHLPANKNSISSNNVRAIIPENDQVLWIGTENGLNRFDKNKGVFTAFKENDNNSVSLSSNSILSLLIDSKKRLWVGTKGGGVNMLYKGTQFSTIDSRMGLSNDVIHGILEDKYGKIWVSTNKGLSKITILNNTLPFTRKDIKIENFTISDGLQSNQFSAASLKTSDDQLFFGGIDGVSYFKPESIAINNFKPKVVITDMMVRNASVSFKSPKSPLTQPIEQTNNITLSYDEAFITLKFAALNFISSEKNQYAYKLSGLRSDDEWHYVGNQRSATYTNLAAGNYVFTVKAANNDGIWSEKETTIKIKVLPPMWKTWWAYTLYTLSICFLLYLFYYYSVKTASLKSELELEHLTREKDLELTQRKMSFFTNISHEIKTPLTLILAPIDKLLGMNEGNNKIQNQLMLMQRNGERLKRLINQLLDFRKFESGSMKLQAAEGNIVRFVKEVAMAFESYAQHRKISLKISVESSSIRAWFDRDKFEKIIYNILSNALKFTPEEGRVIIRVRTEGTDESNRKVVIDVEDNGPGISPLHLPKIFDQFNHFDESGTNYSGTGIGLSFSKGLMELHHGDISVESVPAGNNDHGHTCFTLKFPLGRNHLTDEEIIQNYKDSENITGYNESDIPHSTRVRSEEKKQHVLSAADKEKLIMLVVEDNTEVREFVASHFEQDFEIHIAKNGLLGWEKALETIPDIIVSDVMMPEMSGTSLCSKLKSDARTSHIPVILLTARTPLIFRIEGLETGADDYITKPFNLNILEARIWNLLESRQLLRERYRKDITLQPTNVAITSPDEKFLAKVMSFIEKNIAESTLSVEELGKEVGMSRVTLYRKIKALTNQTAVEFIRSVRLKRAAQLLEQNKLHVSEVAYMVGFIDIDYFRRCFKDQFGHTPKEYASFTSEKN